MRPGGGECWLKPGPGGGGAVINGSVAPFPVLIGQRPLRSRSCQIVVGHILNNAAAKLKEESPKQRDQRGHLQGAVITILVLLGLTLLKFASMV